MMKKPKNVIVEYPIKYAEYAPTYYGDCPSCGLQSKLTIAVPITQKRIKYQVVSLCPCCGQSIDWTEIIGK